MKHETNMLKIYCKVKDKRADMNVAEKNKSWVQPYLPLKYHQMLVMMCIQVKFNQFIPSQTI